jgi:hypothetical protein
MITIDWNTKIIFVPRADMTLVQSTPVEIRELNLNWFRLQLKDIEDDEGMPFLDTHRHNTEVSIAGLTLARVIEIINGYTVTFEDGQYAVNLVGANSNVADVVNVNQVSVRSQNAAGLISSADIEYASYQNCVTVDLTSPYAGTIHPVGTQRQPVNNFSDALLIAAYRGLGTLRIVGDAMVDTGGDYSGLNFIGESMDKTLLTVTSQANVLRCEFFNCTLEGVLDGESFVKESRVGDLEYINGVIERCMLDGVIVLGGGVGALFVDCWRGIDPTPPVIDMGGSGQKLDMRNYSGRVHLRNKTGSEMCVLTLLAGQVIVEDTVTNGLIRVLGNGSVMDEDGNPLESGPWNGATLDLSDLLNPQTISHRIFQAVDVETGLNFLDSMRLILASAAGKLSGAEQGSTTITIKNAQVGDRNRIVATVDEYGNRSELIFDLS